MPHPVMPTTPKSGSMTSMDPRAGQPAQASDLIDVDAVLAAYEDLHPDVSIPDQRVVFGTSGHRGSSLDTAFNRDHILAITQAICEYRAEQGTDGPMFIGADSHALSAPATATALEVFAANGVTVMLDSADGFTPDARGLARHPQGQPEAHQQARRRHLRHAEPQPASGRRLQVQPAQWRPGRQRRHLGDRRQGQRHPGRRTQKT